MQKDGPGAVFSDLLRIIPMNTAVGGVLGELLACDFLVAVNSAVAEFLLDAEKLVVLGHTV